jgi:acetyltransferase-like isoleucine patch superfamily enzyme
MLNWLLKIKRKLFIKIFLTKNYRRYKHFKIGDYTYGRPLLLFGESGSKLTIGRFCAISNKVTIFLGGEHRTDWVTIYPFTSYFRKASYIQGHPKTKGDVVIGNDVWIGYGATIISGVTIGDGAVIGALSVVTKDVAPYEIVAGNPARHIRFRFDNDTIEKLLEIKWWDWDISKIKKLMPLLVDSNIHAFVQTATKYQ